MEVLRLEDRMRRLPFFSCLCKCLLILLGSYAFADGAAGKQKSYTCIACHGAEGISPNDLWPNLAGQKQQYLLAQLKEFHDGDRVNPLMTPIGKMLSEQDMKDLAEYFSQLKAPQ